MVCKKSNIPESVSRGCSSRYRIYIYSVGGCDNFQVDPKIILSGRRFAVEKWAIKLLPEIKKQKYVSSKTILCPYGQKVREL